MNQVAKWLDRPLAAIPARWTSIRMPVAQLHHARVGVSAKTGRTTGPMSELALRWFCKEHDVPVRGVPLSTEWAKLRDRIEDRGQRARLYGLMRYCSGRGIKPGSVDDTILDDYMRYRAETTALASNNTARRSMARTWNACASEVDGWPGQLLTEPPVKTKAGPDWEDFPIGLRRDIDDYLVGLQKVHRGRNGKRIRPCSPSTIRVRKAELKCGRSRKAVELGVPIKSLTSLAVLLHPDLVERVIEAYWQKNGNEPTIFTIELGANSCGLPARRAAWTRKRSSGSTISEPR